jgi:NAD(P)-dependent dehydrogenase (short-subunit alcohol dehydrogenase family)
MEAAKKSVESSIDSALVMNRVIYEKCDTSDMKSVRDFAARVQERCKKINLLINNGLCAAAQLRGISSNTFYSLQPASWESLTFALETTLRVKWR